MISQLLISQKNAYMRLLAGILIWMLAFGFILIHHGLSYYEALTDSLLNTLLLILGIWGLEKIFRYFTPRGHLFWITWFIPTIPSLLIVLISSFALEKIFSTNPIAVEIWQDSFLIRLLFAYLILLSFSLLMNLLGRLESQIEATERENITKEVAKEAELFHLRQQIQPHFLFNSLNSINALIQTKPEKAREMTVQLSEFLRLTIRKDHQKWVALEEELDFVKQYLDIELLRFGHRLQVQYDIDPSVKKYVLPQLLLQPLVENAIKHGLYGTIESVEIRIEALDKSKMLYFSISNPYDKDSKNSSGTGFGLEAVKRRLYLLFGRNDLLEFSQENDIFTVTLKIPQNHD